MARFLHPNRCSEVRDPSKDVGKAQRFKASFQIRHLLNLTWLSWSIACVKVVKALLQILFLLSDAAMPFYDVLWCFENMFSSAEASVDCPSQKTTIYHQLDSISRSYKPLNLWMKRFFWTCRVGASGSCWSLQWREAASRCGIRLQGKCRMLLCWTSFVLKGSLSLQELNSSLRLNKTDKGICGACTWRFQSSLSNFLLVLLMQRQITGSSLPHCTFYVLFFLKLAIKRSHKWWWNALWVTLRVFGQKMGQGRAFARSNEDLFRSGNTFVGTLMNFSCLGHCSDWWARTCRLHGQKRSSKSAAYFRWHGVIWLSRKHDVADGSRVAVVAATTRRQTTDPRCPNDPAFSSNMIHDHSCTSKKFMI